MDCINKHFPGVHALKDVDFELFSGEVHGLVGENGAGKSTLMNILGGVLKQDSGKIILDGEEITIDNSKKAEKLGISFIHQELSLFPNMNIAANIFIQKLPKKNGFLDTKKLNKDTKDILERVSLSNYKPTQSVSMLRIGEQQLIEIGRALAQETKLLVLDEPTSSLTKPEIKILFEIIRTLKSNGVSIVFISHRLDEIYEICDKVTVLRDGERIVTSNIKDIKRSEVVHNMIGRELSEMYEHDNRNSGETILEVKGLSRKDVISDISFKLKAGEIIGLYGLMGSGRTEIARAIFGLDKIDKGDVYIKSVKTNIRKPKDAIKNGIGFITEDRHLEGLVLDHSVKNNFSLASLKKYRKIFGWINSKLEKTSVCENIEKLRIKTPTLKRLVRFLSGGNQQKVVIAKWLDTRPSILIMDEPTRGIDIGAKREIYKIMDTLLHDNVGIILISSELPEVLGVCDRVLVMKEGSLVSEFDKEDLTKEDLLSAAMGV